MEIQHEHGTGKGRFYIGANDDPGAFLSYTEISPGHMSIDHTYVNEELRGGEVGYKLVSAAVTYARMKHIKISPVCTFALAQFKKNKEFEDTWFDH